jgi:hypothetical protein
LLVTTLSLAKIPLLGLCLVAGSLVSTASPSISSSVRAAEPPGRFVEVTEVYRTVTSQGKPVKAGDRLQVAEVRISTSVGGSATLILDPNIGTLNVSENTEVQV